MTEHPREQANQDQPETPSSPPTGYRRLLYATLSALVPGTGQWVAGRRRRGIIMLVVAALVVAGIAMIASQGVSAMIYYLVQPSVLVMIFVVNVLVLLFRGFAIIDAYLSGRKAGTPPRKPSGVQRGIVITVLAVLLVVTAVPHAVVGYYAYITHDMLTYVFTATTPTMPAPQVQPTPEIQPTPAPMPTPPPSPTPTPSPEPTSTPTAEPSPTPTPPPEPTSTPVPQPTPTPTPIPDPFAGLSWHEDG